MIIACIFNLKDRACLISFVSEAAALLLRLPVPLLLREYQQRTTDNIEILFPKEKILYGGCFIKSVDDKTLGNLDDADVKQWENSLKKLEEKFPNPEFVITGHNDWHNKTSIQHTINMVKVYNESPH